MTKQINTVDEQKLIMFTHVLCNPFNTAIFFSLVKIHILNPQETVCFDDKF